MPILLELLQLYLGSVQAMVSLMNIGLSKEGFSIIAVELDAIH